ncbi:MAG: hypothetical protein H7836_13190 [Magnetococcus sp. YQC-3]
MRKLNSQGVSFISSLILLLIAILVAASLVSTVSWESEQAAENYSIAGGMWYNETSHVWQAAKGTGASSANNWLADGVPGGPSLIDLWPLLFIIAPVLYIVKEVFF